MFIPEFWIGILVLPLAYYRGDEAAEVRDMDVAPDSLSLSDIHCSLLRNGHLAKARDLYAIYITLTTAQSIDDGWEDDGCAHSGAQFTGDAQHGLVNSPRRGLFNERDDLRDFSVIIILVIGSLAETLLGDIRCREDARAGYLNPADCSANILSSYFDIELRQLFPTYQGLFYWPCECHWQYCGPHRCVFRWQHLEYLSGYLQNESSRRRVVHTNDNVSFLHSCLNDIG